MFAVSFNKNGSYLSALVLGSTKRQIYVLTNFYLIVKMLRNLLNTFASRICKKIIKSINEYDT